MDLCRRERPSGGMICKRVFEKFLDLGRVCRQRRYPSDLTDEQWALVGPLLPAPGTGGRPEKHPRRSIVDGILSVLRTGCAQRYLPADAAGASNVPWPGSPATAASPATANATPPPPKP